MTDFRTPSCVIAATIDRFVDAALTGCRATVEPVEIGQAGG